MLKFFCKTEITFKQKTIIIKISIKNQKNNVNLLKVFNGYFDEKMICYNLIFS